MKPKAIIKTVQAKIKRTLHENFSELEILRVLVLHFERRIRTHSDLMTHRLTGALKLSKMNDSEEKLQFFDDNVIFYCEEKCLKFKRGLFTKQQYFKNSKKQNVKTSEKEKVLKKKKRETLTSMLRLWKEN